MTDLRISADLSLPVDLVTQTVAILARKGAGKTYTALVMAEEMIKAGLAVVILDPLGATWGLRVSADGTEPGLPVTILGGDHGDIPLEPTAGKVVADVIVDHPGAFIIDMSAFESNTQQDRFVTDFAERIYRAKATKRQPLHLIIDEADSFAPQRPVPGQQRMLGAFEAIVRRGRIRGLGVTLVTQRPAVLNKNVLTQVECLVTLQMTAPQDRAAIDEWVRGNGTKEERDELLASLASLERGDAWFWSPQWLRLFKRAHVRLRETWDSSKTPEAGDVAIEPTSLAAVDLDALRERMAETIERAKDEDPKELHRRIADLERQLLQKTQQFSPEPERIEVPVLSAEALATLTEAVDALRSTAMRIIDAADGIRSALVGMRSPQNLTSGHEVSKQSIPAQPVKLSPDRRRVPTNVAAGIKLSLAERKVLTVLAQYPEGRTKTQIALLTGYAVGGGGFGNALSSLRSKELLEGTKDHLTITDAGIAVLGDSWEPLPTGQALLDHWYGQLAKAERLILETLASVFPGSLSRDVVADQTGYVATGGGFNNALSRLRTLELISGGRDDLRASADLFDGVRR